ncbi:putative paramyosin-like [Cocos nucifera]|nr:putative paramyosin-like [Cocos nucifera]
MAPSAPFSFPTVNNLGVATDFLRRQLILVDGLALEGEDIHHQVSSTFKSLASISHYLVNFAGATFRFSPLELVKERGKLKKFKYYFEKEKVANVDLIRKINCSEKTLSEVQDVIDRQDDELNRTCRRIESLSSKDPKLTGIVIEHTTLFIENTVDLSDRATRFEIENIILKKTKDQLSKAFGKISDRAEATEKKVQDAEAALKKSIKENVRLLGINNVLEVEVEELRARVTKAEASEAEALLVAKIAGEKASRVIDNFRMSKEFRREKALFALDAYDEGKRVVREELIRNICKRNDINKISLFVSFFSFCSDLWNCFLSSRDFVLYIFDLDIHELIFLLSVHAFDGVYPLFLCAIECA